MSVTDYDYVVVGSGAGGGPLAANLAKAGFKVLVMEAGGDPCSENETGRLMYEVPIFHGDSTEYPPCAWNYFVRHYTDETQQRKDEKALYEIDGKATVWYPRAGALGGCTAHNAMITVVPQDSDWDEIAAITGDDSWRGENMRPYFTRLENCQYVPRPGSVKADVEAGVDRARSYLHHIINVIEGRADEDWRDHTHGHGFDGWLKTSEADPKLVLKDPELVILLLRAAKDVLRDHIGNPLVGLQTGFDPNDSRYSGDSPEGMVFTPLAVANGKRNGPREYLLSVQQEFPDNLTIQKHALVTRILFEGTRAVGVEYINQAHVYKADEAAGGDPSTLPREQVRVRREVIIAGGAFNSPQLLMLSGVGPSEQLEKFNIPVVVELPGVGQNLQDRYEVGVISEFAKPFQLIDGAKFSPDDLDNYLKQWEKDGTGVYSTNGALVGIIKRSRKDLPNPDLYIFGLPSFFKGYYRGYSKEAERVHTKFTWAILKARTQNRGYVELASANPWDTPWINFQYFGDGQRDDDPDLEAVVSGIKLAREINDRLREWGVIKREEVPGDEFKNDNKLRKFIRNQAWGHHASCTCKIGADDDKLAVLDSRFRVRGTTGLRVVDASVFPKIPGYFIVTAIYMISEKASDVIQEDAGA
ncbi:MAG: GMC family oxidoreductase [Blastocatellia bacterium]